MEQSLSIYKASAGSGKTFTLAVEYIMGLLLPHAEKEFEHILAVTFTNKATAEMKGRILETLYGLKMGLKESDDYMDAILNRLNEHGDALVNNHIADRNILYSDRDLIHKLATVEVENINIHNLLTISII
jgi:ATP-dependent exoDNAse (exonuclease V) beta subunit